MFDFFSASKGSGESINGLKERFARARRDTGFWWKTPLWVLFSIDKTGAILDANPMLAGIMGSPTIEATRGINMFTFSPLIEAGISGNFRQCLETGEPGVF